MISREKVDELVEVLEKLHGDIINKSGGEHGVRDKGGLVHAAYEILKATERKNSDVFRTAAVIYRMLATRHYFVDGNKRTAHVMARIWLRSHGYRLKVSYAKAIPFIINIANNMPLEGIEQWIKENSVKKS